MIIRSVTGLATAPKQTYQFKSNTSYRASLGGAVYAGFTDRHDGFTSTKVSYDSNGASFSFPSTAIGKDPYYTFESGISSSVNTIQIGRGTASDASLTFISTTTAIPSAKVVSLGDSTFLSKTTGSSTTSRYQNTNFSTKTLGSYTLSTVSGVQTSRTASNSYNTYASTRWEVFDNGDNVTIFSVFAGAGGFPSFQQLTAGAVIGEAGYSVEELALLVVTASPPDALSTFVGSRSWTEYLTTLSEATVEVWDWEAFTSTTQYAGYFEAVTATSSVSVYSATKTANRVVIGTTPQIQTWGYTETTLMTTSFSETLSATVPNKTLRTFESLEAYIKSPCLTTQYKESEAFIADRLFLNSTVVTTSKQRLSMRTVEVTDFTVPSYTIIYESETYEGNYVRYYFTSSGRIGTNNEAPQNLSAIFDVGIDDNFFLEPVGPHGMGGVHRSGNQLGLADNCPHTFPASLLWQGRYASSHAAVSASSFYSGGIPLISHKNTWEWESRTYNWITADSSTGQLAVAGAVNSTSQTSTTFSIGVTGSLDYTGGNVTTQAGGEYFASKKATLVANSPVFVSTHGGTTTFASGTYEITAPMCFPPIVTKGRPDSVVGPILFFQEGSVIYPGIVEVRPTYKATSFPNIFLTV